LQPGLRYLYAPGRGSLPEGYRFPEPAVIRHDEAVAPCYGLMYSYYLDNLNESSLYDIWNTAEYLRFRHRVRNYRFPSCMDCSGAAICDQAEANEDCWGNSPSCADHNFNGLQPEQIHILLKVI
jgi:radical SAM protein with 4Fe4S-binding SPASM domain